MNEHRRGFFPLGRDPRRLFCIYSSAVFLEHLIKAAPFKILCVQTDNGTEFTKKFVSDKARPHLFELKLEELGIQHKLIKPFTPRHNGKVECSHRKDDEYFYASHSVDIKNCMS